MSIDLKYTTAAIATGGREGRAQSADGALDVVLSTPKEMGGAGGDGTNPEQLFAAGYAACFLSALKFTALQHKLAVPADASVTARVGLGMQREGGFGLTVDLTVNLPGLDRAEAEKLVALAHQTCPYSNATRGNIDVGLSIA